jgi:hypothetical protein
MPRSISLDQSSFRATRFAMASAAAAALVITAAGCVSRPATTTTTSSSSAGATPAAGESTTTATVVTLHQEGGFAGLVTDATVDGVAHRYLTVTRHMCGAEGANCPPPTDSAAGPLSDSLAVAAARAVDAAGFFSLERDYGTNPQLRDGYLYTLTVRRGSQTATVRADDSTRPPALGTLTSEIGRIINRARGK